MRLFKQMVILMFVAGLCASAAAGQDTGVVAKVGNVTVSQQDVDRETQKRLPMQVSFHGEINPEKLNEIRSAAFDAVIERAYKVQYAIDEEIAVDPKAFEGSWKELRERVKVPAGMPAEEQARQFEQLKSSLYRDQLAKAAEKVAVEQKIKVGEADVVTYYKANKERFFRPKLYTASQIFVRVEPAATAEERAARKAKAEGLLKQAQSGEDFYNLAYYNSDDRTKYVGGSLGSFHAGQTVKEFDAAIQKMKPGEIAGLVETLYGYHIIRLDAVQDERQLELAEVADTIRAQLVDEQRKALYGEWMAALKAKYPLQRFGK